ncbi:multidrug transporter [Facklamia tabacinasalis]|uniref:Multidrug transporter n=1 Tax=Ruoffia tabacinasalis TaxID=87458 RepID=A0ABS0LIJ7_9LACT|nr:multidrug transporter [Ruoffia tabacinasalis]
MNREEFLKMMIESKFGNVKAFSEFVGVPYTTIRTILENGIGRAGVDNVLKICKGLDISPEQLTNDFKINSVIANTMGTLISLDNNRQVKVYDFTNDQLKEQNNVINFPDRVEEVHKSIINGRKSAAGYAIEVDDYDAEVKSESMVPHGADERVEIAGDSMEPLILKGDEVYIRHQPTVENGEVAIVRIENEGVTCKKFYVDHDTKTITLKSENKKYEDMHFDPSQVTVLGKVLL